MEPAREKLKWITVLGPTAFLVLLVVILLSIHPPFGLRLTQHPLAGSSPITVWAVTLLLAIALGLGATYIFSHFIFSRVQKQEEEILRRSEAMAATKAIGEGIGAPVELDRILHMVIEKAKQLLGVELAVLCLKDNNGCHLPKATVGPSEEFGISVEKTCFPEGEAKCRVGAIPHLDDSKLILDCCCLKGEFNRGHLGVPLMLEGETIGSMCVADRVPRTFSPLEVELFSDLAVHAAVAIGNARLNERLKSLALIEERHRLAREIHDGLAQDLGYLYTKFGHVERILSSTQDAHPLVELKEMKRVTHDVYEEVRQTILVLRGKTPQNQKLVPALTEYLENFEMQTGIEAALDIENEEATRFQLEAEKHLIRIIREALANVRKHSNAKRARIVFRVENNFAKILIKDNGIGFDSTANEKAQLASFGLASMRERAKGIGGTLAILSELGRGTTVEVSLPLDS